MPDGYELIAGTIDLHCHAGPDLFRRPFDVAQLAKQAKVAGMRAILVKNHILPTSGVAGIVTDHVDGVAVFGSITLNWTVGGLNPQAVYAAAKFGAKEVKMPTMHAQSHLSLNKGAAWSSRLFDAGNDALVDTVRNVRGIRIIDDKGKLLPEIFDIFEILKAKKMILATGHVSLEEMVVLVREARKAGVERVVVNHVENYNTRVPLDQQREFVRLGAFLEHCFNSCMPIYYKDGKIEPEEIAYNVKELGASQSVLSTDFGQPYNPAPADGMRFYAETMLRCGMPATDIERMMKTNPAALLDLD